MLITLYHLKNKIKTILKKLIENIVAVISNVTSDVNSSLGIKVRAAVWMMLCYGVNNLLMMLSTDLWLVLFGMLPNV